jgi:hypothetical protein
MVPKRLAIARLDLLGIVAGLCREIGLADCLDVRALHRAMNGSVGARPLWPWSRSGLGCANRRLNMVCQFLMTKPVAHLLGPAITAVELARRVSGPHPRLAPRPGSHNAV